VRARGQARARGESGSGSDPGPQSVSDLRSGMTGGARPSARVTGRRRRWAAMGQNSGWAAAGKEWAAGLGCWAAEGLLFFFFLFPI
jgi:hypothetical protein